MLSPGLPFYLVGEASAHQLPLREYVALYPSDVHDLWIRLCDGVFHRLVQRRRTRADLLLAEAVWPVLVLNLVHDHVQRDFSTAPMDKAVAHQLALPFRALLLYQPRNVVRALRHHHHFAVP